MLIVDRQRRILEHLRAHGTAGLEQLAAMLGVSTSTVRRDVDALVGTGQIQRTHGGVVLTDALAAEGMGASGHGVMGGLITGPGQTASLAERMTHNVEEKKAIGQVAASMVQPNMTLLMDAGSTVVYAAEQITARPLQVVTSSLSVANLFANDDEVELIVIGGSLYPRSSALVGPLATSCLADLHADLLFYSLAGIYEDLSGQGGGEPGSQLGSQLGVSAYNINLDMAHVEQTMMRQAAQSVMLMDASKFGRKSLVRVCGLEQVDQIITDDRIDPYWQDKVGPLLTVA